VRLVLAALHRVGASIRHHGDFDVAGVQIFRDLEARYGAVPWHYDVAALRAALTRLGHEVPFASTAGLERALAAVETGIAEELLLDALLDDLGQAKISRW
jgi:hypothetical protein